MEYGINGETCEKIEGLINENGISEQVNRHIERFKFDVKSEFILNNISTLSAGN
jgi:hypothetical protein